MPSSKEKLNKLLLIQLSNLILKKKRIGIEGS
jgi:hypothetical protein